jgi:hypothetical protein
MTRKSRKRDIPARCGPVIGLELPDHRPRGIASHVGRRSPGIFVHPGGVRPLGAAGDPLKERDMKQTEALALVRKVLWEAFLIPAANRNIEDTCLQLLREAGVIQNGKGAGAPAAAIPPAAPDPAPITDAEVLAEAKRLMLAWISCERTDRPPITDIMPEHLARTELVGIVKGQDEAQSLSWVFYDAVRTRLEMRRD